ncbi:uncharacterized protein LOC126880706 [Diabrotica virgifera virgifera]|uniref:Peptidase aspartic putative domain-containing protein n=1 Tax=Diabrotica virgifera virgifera TaxID=50390 RepID=A0ABM5JRY5_DIAVI|nr:uncharacterized protein LOC126880706 [Diabrotica virgifera virgifera]
MDRSRKLKFQRHTALNDIQSIYDLGSKAVSDHSLRSLFKIRCSELDVIKEEFLKQHTSIINNVLSVPDSDTGDEEKVRELFLDLFYKIKVFDAEFFGSPSESPGSASCASGGAHPSHIRLPRIDLPRFQGSFINFASFIDLYNSIVHNNAALGNVEKFKYLKGCLDGTPLSLILNLPITNDNYQVAYDLIVKRYTNVRRCATAHWDAIMGVQKISAVNSKNLAKLVDTFLENLAALKTLGLPTEHWDFIMFNLLLSKLDVDSIKLFELENKSNQIPSFKKLVAFIETQYIAYDNLDSSIGEGKKSSRAPNNTEPKANSKHQTGDSRHNRSSSSFVTNSSSVCCALCKQSHYLNQCSLFLKKSPKERYQFCKEFSSCFKCLNQANHSVKSCPKSFKCSKCSSHLHNSLLHFERNRSNSQSSSENNSPGTSGIESSPEVSHCAASFVGNKNETKKEILLGTVLVHAIDSKGCKQPLRCLIDSGSMSSFISRKAANRLGWPKTPCSFEVNGLNSMQTKLNQRQISFSIQPRHLESPVFHLEAIITDRVCSDLPSTQIDISAWNYIKNLKLADPKFNCSQSVDLLIGCSIFSKVFLEGKIEDSSLRKFWELENIPEEPVSEPEDVLCETIYRETHSRDVSGKYVVSLPFRESPPCLKDSYDVALNRFISLERRLFRQPGLQKDYSSHMQEYIDLGHMQLVPEGEKTKGKYYIPHHCVVKSESVSTKIRVVYNASQKSPRLGKSLNDYLLVGPNLQQDIVSLLLNFRLNRFALCADIRQMYRNILVVPEHTDYQRVLWRFSSFEEIQEYRLLTVTFGVVSSPYLALRTLQQLVLDEGSRFPKAASLVCNASYIDDFVFGASTLEEAQSLVEELVALLKLGGFELRKWCSNEPKLLSQFPESHINPHSINFDPESNGPSLKILEVPPSLREKSPSEEVKKSLVFVSTREEHFLSCLLENQSSFTSIQRILAFMLRFAHNSRLKRSRRVGPLSAVELESSLIILVRFTQEQYFEDQLQSTSFPKPFRKLGVFLDDNTQCLRVGGRLSQSSLSYEAKHPFLLPKKSRLTTLLVRHYHEKYLHAGFKSTQFLISL